MSRALEQKTIHVQPATRNITEALIKRNISSIPKHTGCKALVCEEEMLTALTLHTLPRAEALMRKDMRQRLSEEEALELQGIQNSWKNIHTRAYEKECPITYADISIRATVSCCGHAFECAALLECLRTCRTCPMCRHALKPSDIILTIPGSSRCGAHTPGAHTRDVHMALSHELKAIQHAMPNAKVVIFGAFGMRSVWHDAVVARTVERTAFSLGYLSRVLQTNKRLHTLQDRVDAFEAREYEKTLLIDATHLPDGLRMDFVTHVITLGNVPADIYDKILACCQNHGMPSPLRVINFRFV